MLTTSRKSTFGGPSDGRPVVTPGDGSPDYGAQIDKWKSKLKGADKGHKRKLRNKIQGAKVDRWSDKVKEQKNAPTPKDSIYNAEVAAANKTYGDSMIGAGLEESNTHREYGFDPQYANPYSRASALTASWQRDQRQTLNSYAAGGQLYSGARESAVARDDRNYDSDRNAAELEYGNQLAGVEADRAVAREQLWNDILAADDANMERALDPANQPDAPPPPKFIKKEKRDLKDKLGDLREKKSDAKNKFARKKVKKAIKRTKKNLKSIPDQYAE